LDFFPQTFDQYVESFFVYRIVFATLTFLYVLRIRIYFIRVKH